MNELSAVWTVLGLLITVLAFFARYFIRKIDALSDSKSETQLTAFQSMDNAREKDWNRWREDRVEITFNDHERRLQSHTADISRILGRMNGNHK